MELLLLDATSSYSSSPGCVSCAEEGKGLRSPVQDPTSVDEALSPWSVELADILRMVKAELFRTQVNPRAGIIPKLLFCVKGTTVDVCLTAG